MKFVRVFCFFVWWRPHTFQISCDTLRLTAVNLFFVLLLSLKVIKLITLLKRCFLFQQKEFAADFFCAESKRKNKNFKKTRKGGATVSTSTQHLLLCNLSTEQNV